MNIQIKHRVQTTLLIAAVILLLTALLNALWVQNVFAATGTMYVSPSSSSVEQNKSLTVNVRINPGSSVDTVHVSVSYNASMLTYTGMSYAGSPFNIQPTSPIVSGSTITFDQVSLSGPVTGDSLIAGLTFTAKASSGSSAISLSGSDAALAGTSTHPSLTSASVSFTTPPAPPTSGTDTPTTPTTPSTPTSPTPNSPKGNGSDHSTKKDNQPKNNTSQQSTTSTTSTTSVISTDVRAGYTDATVVASSTEPTKAYVKYGINGQLTSTTTVSDFSKEHTLTLDPSLLVPGTTYSYVVVTTDQNGVETQSDTATFHTKGMSVEVKVLNSSAKPIGKQKVTLHSEPQTTTTNDEGIAVFTDVAPGTHSVQYTASGKTYSSEIVVLNTIHLVNNQAVASPQNFAVKLAVKDSTVSIANVITGVLILAMVAVAYYLMQQRRNKALALQLQYETPTNVTPMPTQPVNDTATVAPQSTTDSTDAFLRRRGPLPEPGTVIPSDNDSQKPEVKQ